MYSQASQNRINRPISVIRRKVNQPIIGHEQRVYAELKNAGLSKLALASMETHYLPRLIHADEHIEGAVFGYQEVGFSMLVATNWRVIFLDRKPLFTNTDEVHYQVVSGVKNNHAAFGTTVVLHTKVRDYKIFTFNRKSAKRFVGYIELCCMENGYQRRVSYDQFN